MNYKVVIEETQRIIVEVEADSPEEAEQVAEDNHWAGEYDIDDSDDRSTTYTVQNDGGDIMPNIDHTKSNVSFTTPEGDVIKAIVSLGTEDNAWISIDIIRIPHNSGQEVICFVEYEYTNEAGKPHGLRVGVYDGTKDEPVYLEPYNTDI